MSILNFIYCHACNPQGSRTEKIDSDKYRCSSDVQYWYEGEEKDALEFGWIKSDEEMYLCPKCQRSILGGRPDKIMTQQDDSTV